MAAVAASREGDFSDSDISLYSNDDDVKDGSNEKDLIDDNEGSAEIIPKKKFKESRKGTTTSLFQKEHQTGIVYLSRIPPFMKPHKVRQIFSQYGEVGRLFLQPEDPSVRRKRKKGGGNKKKMFTEGWIEFMDRRTAKMVATCLNNQLLGGKKRSYYHDDIWNIKYLPKFKWTNLTEKLAYEQAVRDQKLRTEVNQAKRENKFYLSNVEKQKAYTAMEERKKRKNPIRADKSTLLKREYKQRVVLQEGDTTSAGSTKSLISDDVLSKVFGSKSRLSN